VGTLVKCDNTPVTNGYVYITSVNGTYIFTAVTNGAFSFNVIYCASNTQFTFEGVDIDNSVSTDAINYNFNSPVTNIGNLQACTAVDEFISYQIDNNPVVYIISNVNGGFGQGTIGGGGGIFISGTSPTQSIYIWGDTYIPGIYTTAQFTMEGNGFGVISQSTTNTIQFNLSQFGAVGEYIDMTFSGTYQEPNGGNHTLTGVAHVIRDN
jgi:hypothetical protein